MDPLDSAIFFQVFSITGKTIGKSLIEFQKSVLITKILKTVTLWKTLKTEKFNAKSSFSIPTSQNLSGNFVCELYHTKTLPRTLWESKMRKKAYDYSFKHNFPAKNSISYFY